MAVTAAQRTEAVRITTDWNSNEVLRSGEMPVAQAAKFFKELLSEAESTSLTVSTTRVDIKTAAGM